MTQLKSEKSNQSTDPRSAPECVLLKKFRKNVIAILRERRMLRIDLADRLSIHKSNVTHILNGRQSLTIQVLEQWAKALRVKPYTLLM